MAEHEITRDDLTRAEAIARGLTTGQPWLFEDAYSAAAFALVAASRKYDGSGTWSGYSGQRMRWAAQDEIKRQVGRGAARAIKGDCASLDALIDAEWADDAW